MHGKANEYGQLRGRRWKNFVNTVRSENSRQPPVYKLDEDDSDYEVIEDYKREGIPDPDGQYNGRTVY